jgi:cytochrome P450
MQSTETRSSSFLEAAMSDHKASDFEKTDSQLCRDFDLYNAEHSERVYEILGYAQQHCPVLPTPADDGYFVVTRYDDVRTVLQNPQMFSSRKASLRGTGGVRVPPIDTDPPLHHDFRKVLNPFFHPNYLKRYEAGMAEFAASRIDQWIERGECDFIDEFARPYIADVLALVVFNEDDPELFRRAGEINHEMATNASEEIFHQFADLIAEFIDRRVAAGVKKDDVVTAIIDGSVGGRPMTKEEQVGVVQLLFSGGLDTTIVALSNIMLHITEQPTLEDELRSGDWIRTHFDEFLRFESPVSAEPLQTAGRRHTEAAARHHENPQCSTNHVRRETRVVSAPAAHGSGETGEGLRLCSAAWEPLHEPH